MGSLDDDLSLLRAAAESKAGSGRPADGAVSEMEQVNSPALIQDRGESRRPPYTAVF